MYIKRFFISAGFLALCSAGAPANAAIMTIGDMVSFSFDSYDTLYDRNPGQDPNGNNYLASMRDLQTVSLERFDSTLGNLLDVDIWFESAWSLASTVHSYDTHWRNRTASGAGRSVSNQAVRMIDPDRAVERNHEVVSSNCRDTQRCRDVNRDTGAFNAALDLSSFTLADFIGSDALNFRLVRNLKADLTRCGRFDRCYLKNSRNAWHGDIFVNYTYSVSESEVPEPSVVALMGLGLLGLGASRLLQRKS
ncbi:MAG: PEP-CTERM sorting domain-containing protein [Candidatus Thiodiazotropha sp. (ex Dulcina madagascariensis)]|nr:PEP-CTERM sorting domain-containing protein [Candidatus Thiodiazotropha sp. (ex Dulcina madagascariensis)]